MSLAYKRKLQPFLGMLNIVVVHRQGAPDLEGQVTALEDDGCEITTEKTDPHTAQSIFVAYKHIRGVGQAELKLGR